MHTMYFAYCYFAILGHPEQSSIFLDFLKPIGHKVYVRTYTFICAVERNAR